MEAKASDETASGWNSGWLINAVDKHFPEGYTYVGHSLSSKRLTDWLQHRHDATHENAPLADASFNDQEIISAHLHEQTNETDSKKEKDGTKKEFVRDTVAYNLLLHAALCYQDSVTVKRVLETWGYPPKHYLLLAFSSSTATLNLARRSSESAAAKLPPAGPAVRCKLEKTRFNKPTWCNYCDKFIYGVIGKQGYACTVCNFTCHPECKDKVAEERVCGEDSHNSEHPDQGGQISGDISASDTADAASVERKTEFQEVPLPCFVCANDEHIIISFRGTEPLNFKHWMQDFMIKMKCVSFTFNETTESGDITMNSVIDGKVHSGFWDALNTKRLGRGNSLIEEIVEYIHRLDAEQQKQQQAEHSEKPFKLRKIFITGHSLGGALSVIACANLFQLGLHTRVRACHTFGQPRIGDAGFCAAIDKIYGKRIVRYVNGSDLVCRMPPGDSAPSVVSSLLDTWQKWTSSSVPTDLANFTEPIGICVYLDRDPLTGEGRVTTMGSGASCPNLEKLKMLTQWLVMPYSAALSLWKGKEHVSRSMARVVLHDSVMAHFPVAYLEVLLSRLNMQSVTPPPSPALDMPSAYTGEDFDENDEAPFSSPDILPLHSY